MHQPFAERIFFREHLPDKDVTLEFRLIYRGSLKAASQRENRADNKQSIRKYLHPQLKQWWEQNRKWIGDSEVVAKNFDSFGFRFVPVIRQPYGCALEILFLRRDAPGNLIRSGGDIDNRLKVLFDGLRMPHERNELAGATPEDGEDPFFCLLQDDALVTEVCT